MIIQAPISVGELVDKCSILYIKLKRIEDLAKAANVMAESKLLNAPYELATAGLTADKKDALGSLSDQLLRVNEKIWDIEDAIRDCERAKDFGPKFIELARGVYHNNDERARLKKEINLLMGSTIVEEKSYAEYRV